MVGTDKFNRQFPTTQSEFLPRHYYSCVEPNIFSFLQILEFQPVELLTLKRLLLFLANPYKQSFALADNLFMYCNGNKGWPLYR